jgi:hypothetical protein
MGLFLQQVVTDEDGTPLAEAVGLIYDIEDDANVSPLAIFTPSGVAFPLNELVSNHDGVTPEFEVEGKQRVKWVSGAFEVGLVASDPIPVGGNPGQVLTKASNVDLDVVWDDPLGIAPGGIDGQVLVKDGSEPYATRWGSASTGGGGTGGTTSFLPGTVGFVRQSANGSWPVRPTNSDDVLIIWVGVDALPAIVSTGVNGPHVGDVFIERRLI